MKLKKDTWHYRNWEYWLATSLSRRSDKYREYPHMYYHHKPEQVNLCIYFWVAVARTPLLKLGRNSVIQGLGAFLMVYMVAFIAGNALMSWREEYSALEWLLLHPLIGAVLMATVVGIGALGSYLLELRRRKKYSTTQKEPNIFVEHVKAKKDKVCPILEFE